MPAPSVSYTFTNSTTANATEVNANFTDLVNGASDGTKDYTINALTCNSTVTLNGNTTIGNASSDDFTITASLAASVAIKTTFTVDVGSATKGLKSVYLGSNDSAAQTVRLISGAVASAYTITLPTATGTIGQALYTSDANSSLVWRHHHKFTASKTSNYTATGDETIIPCDTASAFTVTLPAASTMTGKMLIIKKTSSDFNAVTIDGNASETIDGATTTTINTQYEALHIACDGSNWHIIERTYPRGEVTYTPTLTGFGTVSSLTAAYWRLGDGLGLRVSWTCGTSTATEARCSLPTGLTHNMAGFQKVGDMGFSNSGAVNQGHIFAETGALAYVVFTRTLGGIAGTDKSNGNSLGGSGDSLYFIARVPITGWKG